MLIKTLFANIVLLLLAAAALGQSGLPVNVPQTAPNIPDVLDAQGARPGRLGSPEAEILKRAEIRYEEENHREMVERANEAEQLAINLRADFDKSKTLGREDLKRLEKVEKLARKIRGSAGGSDDNVRLDDPPARLEDAVSRLAEVSVKLGESARKTSRLVVSGAVIEHSNELIELIRHIRTFVKP